MMLICRPDDTMQLSEISATVSPIIFVYNDTKVKTRMCQPVTNSLCVLGVQPKAK